MTDIYFVLQIEVQDTNDDLHDESIEEEVGETDDVELEDYQKDHEFKILNIIENIKQEIAEEEQEEYQQQKDEQPHFQIQKVQSEPPPQQPQQQQQPKQQIIRQPKRPRHFQEQNNDSLSKSRRFEAPKDQNPLNIDVTNNSTSSIDAKDEYDIFGAFVANELKSLSSNILRKRLKLRIQQCILEIASEDGYQWK